MLLLCLCIFGLDPHLWVRFPLDGLLVHSRFTPSIKFASTHLNTWVERGTMRVKCHAQEHDAMSLVRAQTLPIKCDF